VIAYDRMLILGIETSCDDTAAALVEVKDGNFRVKKNVRNSQAKLHNTYGGVVPEVAARKHTENIIPVIDETIGKHRKDIDIIAVTKGPGLITSLHVGVETAKSLSYAWNIPLVGANHMEGHVYSPLLNDKISRLKFPAIALIVSGGHTELILMTSHGKYKLLGRTRDDASGEAFDKAAKMMGLPYPGGPAISKHALRGNPKAYDLPKPMLDQDNYEFSFSGLKNAIRLLIVELKKKNKKLPIDDLCASIEQTIVDILITKSLKAIEQHKPKTFILAGGVAANKKLRKTLQNALPKSINLLMSDLEYTQDNAAMIAAGACNQIKKKQFTKYSKLNADPNWELV
jgi:N6-L-threonylcarbamoyladenine synthase